jgi:hypothetical protein
MVALSQDGSKNSVFGSVTLSVLRRITRLETDDEIALD